MLAALPEQGRDSVCAFRGVTWWEGDRNTGIWSLTQQDTRGTEHLWMSPSSVFPHGAVPLQVPRPLPMPFGTRILLSRECT